MFIFILEVVLMGVGLGLFIGGFLGLGGGCLVEVVVGWDSR